MKWIVLHVLWWVWTIVWWHKIIIVSYTVFSPLIKTSVFYVFISPPLQTPGNHWSFYCLHCFAFSRMAYTRNLFFFFPWREGFKVFMPITPLMAQPHVDRTGSRWQTPPLNTVAFLPVLSPVPLVLPSSHVQVKGDMCWVSVHRKATSFVPLVTMNPNSCWVCCKHEPFLQTPCSEHTPEKIFLMSPLCTVLHVKKKKKTRTSS